VSIFTYRLVTGFNTCTRFEIAPLSFPDLSRLALALPHAYFPTDYTISLMENAVFKEVRGWHPEHQSTCNVRLRIEKGNA